MNKVSFGGKEYTVGLTWQQLTGTESRAAEIKRLVKQVGHGYGVVRQVEDDTQVGMCPKAFAGSYSAAATLADAVSRCMLIEDLGEGNYWYVLVLDGQVAPGSDMVGDLETIQSKYEEGYFLHGIDAASQGSLPIFAKGLTEVFEGSQDTGFVELIGGNPAKRCRIGDLNKSSSALLAVAVIALMAGGYYYYANYYAQPVIEPLAPTFSAPAHSPLEIREQAVAQEKSWLAQIMSRPDFADSLDDALSGYFRLPAFAGEWQNLGFKYTTGGPIHVSWSRLALGHMGSLASRFEGLEFDEKGERAILPVPVSAAESRVINPEQLDSLLTEGRHGYSQLLSLFQIYELEGGVTAKQQPPRREPVVGLETANPNAPLFAYRVYEVEVKGAHIEALTSIVNKLSQFPSLFLKDLEVERSDAGLLWRITGEYYAH